MRRATRRLVRDRARGVRLLGRDARRRLDVAAGQADHARHDERDDRRVHDGRDRPLLHLRRRLGLPAPEDRHLGAHADRPGPYAREPLHREHRGRRRERLLDRARRRARRRRRPPRAQVRGQRRAPRQLAGATVEHRRRRRVRRLGGAGRGDADQRSRRHRQGNDRAHRQARSRRRRGARGRFARAGFLDARRRRRRDLARGARRFDVSPPTGRRPRSSSARRRSGRRTWSSATASWRGPTIPPGRRRCGAPTRRAR